MLNCYFGLIERKAIEMARLNVGDAVKAALKNLLGLSDDAYQEIYDVVRRFPVELHSLDKLISAANGMRFSSNRDGEAILRAISALEITWVKSSLGLDQFINDLVEAIELGGGTDADKFHHRISELLTQSNFSIGAKGITVLTDNSRNFGAARILSDIRPVFDVNGQDDQGRLEIAAAVLVHSLKIVFTEDGSEKAVYINLDDDDLDVLISTLNRAKKKVESLEGLLDRAEIPKLRTKRS